MDSTEETGRRATLATGICIAAAIAMAVGTFLPMADGAGQPLGENTLIQHGGWAFLLLGFWIAFAAVERHGIRDRIAIIVQGAIGVGFAYRLGTDHSLLTFYPVDAHSQPQANLPGTLEDPGIGIWLCGMASAAAVLAAIMMPTPPKAKRARDARAAIRHEATPEAPDQELLAAWDGVEINPDELDPITRRALKRAGRI